MHFFLSWIGILLVLFVLALIYFFANTFRLKEERVSVEFEKLPEAFDGYKIVHLSDLHLEMNQVASSRVKKRIQRMQPDLIVLTGDTAESKRGIKRALRYLKGLQSPDGIYAVFGNHEYHGSRKMRQQLAQVYQHLGIQLLRNESVRLERGSASFDLIGVDDYCTSHEDVDRAFSGCRQEGFRLLLTHDPNLADELPSACASYALGGHFHGGQIRLPGIFKFHPMGELPARGIVNGLHQIQGIKWYISRGLGQVGYPFRFRSLPEVTLHTLYCKKADNKRVKEYS